MATSRPVLIRVCSRLSAFIFGRSDLVETLFAVGRRLSSLAGRGDTSALRINHLATVPTLEKREAYHQQRSDQIRDSRRQFAAGISEPTPRSQYHHTSDQDPTHVHVKIYVAIRFAERVATEIIIAGRCCHGAAEQSANQRPKSRRSQRRLVQHASQ